MLNQLAQNRAQWRVILNVVIRIRLSLKADFFKPKQLLTKCSPVKSRLTNM